jgi:hypothetical protein
MATTPVKLYPTTRPYVRDALMNFLYKKDQNMAENVLADIINENITLTHPESMGFVHYNGSRAFMYLGKIHKSATEANKVIAPPLHRSLHARMNAYLRDRQAVEKEEKLIIKNFLTAVLNTSHSYADWMRILPSEVHRPIIDFFNMNWYEAHEAILTNEQVEAFQKKQEQFLNMLKGRLAMNLFL